MLKTAIEVPEQPYHLSWDITSACNLKCSFCYSSKNKSQVESKDLIDLILDQIVELSPLHLGIGGGEPTESDYLMYVLEFIFKTMGNKMPVISIDSMQLSKHPDLLVSARRVYGNIYSLRRIDLNKIVRLNDIIDNMSFVHDCDLYIPKIGGVCIKGNAKIRSVQYADFALFKNILF